MTTADQIFREFCDKSSDQEPYTDDEWETWKESEAYTSIIAAMKVYAKAAIEEDRKDSAFRLTGNLLAEGIMVPDSKILPHITDRPLPELK